MNEKIAALQAEFEAELAQVADMTALEALRVGYLGKKGKMTELLKGMGNMSVEERKTIGAETNELKNQITVALGEKLEAMKLGKLEIYGQDGVLQGVQKGYNTVVRHSVVLAKVSDTQQLLAEAKAELEALQAEKDALESEHAALLYTSLTGEVL